LITPQVPIKGQGFANGLRFSPRSMASDTNPGCF
jgi:hypothetical protein